MRQVSPTGHVTLPFLMFSYSGSNSSGGIPGHSHSSSTLSLKSNGTNFSLFIGRAFGWWFFKSLASILAVCTTHFNSDKWGGSSEEHSSWTNVSSSICWLPLMVFVMTTTVGTTKPIFTFASLNLCMMTFTFGGYGASSLFGFRSRMKGSSCSYSMGTLMNFTSWVFGRPDSWLGPRILLSLPKGHEA